MGQPDQPTGRGLAPWALFCDDFSASWRAWRRVPGLPLTTVGLVVVERALWEATRETAWFSIPAVVLGIVALGFYGTQRIWYLRGFRNDRLQRGELWSLTRAFLGRFFVLGLLTSLVGAPITIVAANVDGAGRVVAIVGWSLVLDFSLTFVTPAVAFSTRSTMAAVRLGARTIKHTWPRSRWYVLTPGLVATALWWVLPSSSGVGDWAFGLSAVAGSLLALLFKGAGAAFYLRLHPEVGDTGAAYVDTYDNRRDWEWS